MSDEKRSEKDNRYYEDIPTNTEAGRGQKGQLEAQADVKGLDNVDMHKEPETELEQKKHDKQLKEKGIVGIDTRHKSGDMS